MWHIRDGVEQTTDAVATIRPNDATFVGARHLLNGRSKISIQRPRFHQRQGGGQTIKRRFHDPSPIFIHVTNAKGFVKITVVSTQIVRRHVNVDDIPVLNFSIIRNTVTDHFVDGGTDRFWEIVVIQRGGITTSFQTRLVYDSIDLIRRHPRPDGPSGNVQNFSAHLTRVSQTVFSVQLFGSVDSDRVVMRLVSLFRLGNSGTVIGVVGLFDDAAAGGGDQPFG
mmetsp:Transcript_33983/g.53046  ORF Transcript_33983/g.53046 Transcript_33983/m.53046 type:complete len:224 (+) Transcript_33983:1-672(+)